MKTYLVPAVEIFLGVLQPFACSSFLTFCWLCSATSFPFKHLVSEAPLTWSSLPGRWLQPAPWPCSGPSGSLSQSSWPSFTSTLTKCSQPLSGSVTSAPALWYWLNLYCPIVSNTFSRAKSQLHSGIILEKCPVKENAKFFFFSKIVISSKDIISFRPTDIPLCQHFSDITFQLGAGPAILTV